MLVGEWLRAINNSLSTRRDSLVDRKRIERGAFAWNLRAPTNGKPLCLQVSSEIIKVGAERTVPEIGQRAFFFVPVFEQVVTPPENDFTLGGREANLLREKLRPIYRRVFPGVGPFHSPCATRLHVVLRFRRRRFHHD